MTTVAEFADLWTSGALAQRYPSRVRVRKAVAKDVPVLRKRILAVIGSRPIADLTLEDAEAVVDALPITLSAGYRRRVTGLLVRLLDLAVYPAKLLKVNPIPKSGFMPLAERSTYTYLRPAEDAQLMACVALPFDLRLFWGLCAREGFRVSELLSLTWSDVDLSTGIVTLAQHKTVRSTGARSWPLDPGSLRTLRWLRQQRPTQSEWACIFETTLAHVPSRDLRPALRIAGLLRRELHERTVGGRPLRAHDLRGSFVTIARAAGRSDAWIMDRTGHTTGVMLAKYARPAREAADRGFGWWQDLDAVLPELSGSSGPEEGASSAPTPKLSTGHVGTPWPHEVDHILSAPRGHWGQA